MSFALSLHLKLPLLFFFFLLVLFFCSPVYAQTAPNNQITVSPSIIQLDLANDLPEALLTYTNNTQTPITITLSAANITSLEEGYKINYINNGGKSASPFEIASDISFSRNTLVLAPHSSSQVFVLIRKDQLTPGGHYGTVMAHIQQETNSTGIHVQGILSSLIFVRTNTGKEIESAHLSSFNVNNTLTSFPTIERFQIINTGNVDITPYGLISITDMFHHMVAKNIINQDSFLTLPQSARDYNTTITLLQKRLWPSIYTIDLSLHYGKSMQKIHTSITFVSLGTYGNYFIAGGVALLILIVLLISVRFWRK